MFEFPEAVAMVLSVTRLSGNVVVFTAADEEPPEVAAEVAPFEAAETLGLSMPK